MKRVIIWSVITIFLIFGLVFLSSQSYREYNFVVSSSSAQESNSLSSVSSTDNLSPPLNYCLETTEFSSEDDKQLCFQPPYLIKNRGLEINLTKRKVALYDDGKLVAVLPLSYQSPENVWFESPTGLYKIRTKEKLHWSTIGKVWMPYSMQYYEDFFLHGIPYYPDGRKLTSTVSGGCLRFADEVAQKLYEFVKIGDPVLVYATLDNLTPKEDIIFPLDLESSYIFQRFYNPWRRFRRFSGDRAHLDLDYYNHTGVDFKLKRDAINKNVYAVQDGKVAKVISTSKDDQGMGNTIILEHQTDRGYIYSLYAHLSSIKAGLKEGDTVRGGDMIGTIGSSGFGCLNYWRLGRNGCDSNDPPNEFLHFEIKTAPVLGNPSGGKVCFNRYNKHTFCYGYAPNPLSRLGYIDPISFLFESQNN
ncbi:peptidoglycan DD-metalloendopeptidase family protein [bacterium]|nr:peptidoglycan DD-metalloendopeptidase family protein [bacterium]